MCLCVCSLLNIYLSLSLSLTRSLSHSLALSQYIYIDSVVRVYLDSGVITYLTSDPIPPLTDPKEDKERGGGGGFIMAKNLGAVANVSSSLLGSLTANLGSLGIYHLNHYICVDVYFNYYFSI